MSARLPTHLEVSGIIRAVQAAGGFAMVLAKGERDAGTVALVTIGHAEPDALYERMPQLDGTRIFVRTKTQDPENQHDFSEYLRRRADQDRDLWLLELDIADGERFIAEQLR